MEQKQINFLYDEALHLWGEPSQIDLLEEECAELILALKHLKRNKPDSVAALHAVAGELADVQIMIEQISRMCAISTTVAAQRQLKLERLQDLVLKAQEDRATRVAEVGGLR